MTRTVRPRRIAVGIDGSLASRAAARPTEGDPRDVLRQVDCDVLVVGARGHHRVADLLVGSVSSHLARHARGPVVIVPCPPS